ncbi:MAG: hypothetical protein J6K32_10070 [Clostridia bacterium]|nr:hypothetical protein [Clostridia bacterium]
MKRICGMLALLMLLRAAAVQAQTVYCNTNGGRYYHTQPRCEAIDPKYRDAVKAIEPEQAEEYGLIGSCGYCGKRAAESGDYAIIDAGEGGRLHLRARPSKDAESMGLYYTGTEVLCRSDAKDGWMEVGIGAHTGYMHMDYLKAGEVAHTIQPQWPEGIVIAEQGASMMNSPTKNSGSGMIIPKGESVTVMGMTAGHFYWVEYRAWHGYIQADALELHERNPADGLLNGIWRHSNGSSAWSTELTIHADGAFTGCYSDEAAESRTRYETRFYGVFSNPERIDEYQYRTSIVQLDYISEPGVQFIDGVMVITGEPAGVREGAAYTLYLPGFKVSNLKEAERYWPYESVDGVLIKPYLCQMESGRGFTLR